MKTQHTLGPLTVHGPCPTNASEYNIRTPDGGIVAIIGRGHHGQPLPPAMSQAAADLFAAAPDLLAALENILNARCFRNDLALEHHAALDQCRDAIAKAKGGTK